jgi:hypothetical protein
MSSSFPLEMLGLNKVSGRCACPAKHMKHSGSPNALQHSAWWLQQQQTFKLQSCSEKFSKSIARSLTVPFGLAVLTYELAFVLSASACLQHLSPAWSNPQLRQVP